MLMKICMGFTAITRRLFHSIPKPLRYIRMNNIYNPYGLNEKAIYGNTMARPIATSVPNPK